MPAICEDPLSTPVQGEDDFPRPSGPWASGRVLTGAQRERKRRMDRLKQKDRRHKNSLMVKGLKAQVNELSAKLTSLGQCGPITVSTPETSHGSGLDPVDGSITPEFHYTISQPDLFLVGSSCAQPSFFESSINPESSVVSIPAPNPMLSVGFEERLCARGQASHLEEDQRLQRHQQDCAGTNVAAANSVSTIQNTFNNLVHQACATERQYICADELLNQDADPGHCPWLAYCFLPGSILSSLGRHKKVRRTYLFLQFYHYPLLYATHDPLHVTGMWDV